MVRESLGHYKIIRQIGAGGMGEVYAAEDPKLGRQVAIKVLPEDMASQAQRVQRFEREAKAVAALDHPNIVTIYSVEEEDGLHFITMQLVEGETLSERIPNKGLSLEKFFDLAIPLADAISAAHEHGVIHRDLKPANVMVASDGRVKVLDFGLAQLREGTVADGPTIVDDTPLTGEGKIMGTVAYMSPEQAEGKTVDHRSDIFSLGIILYEMATGERPFKGDTNISVISSIVKETPSSITELNATLPRHLGRIVRHCLAKDPGKRCQTARDVRNELTELKKEIDSGEIAAPIVPTMRRRWVWPLVSALPLVALLLVLFAPDLVLGGEDSGPVVVERIPLTDLSGNLRGSSLSPDGEYLLYDDNTLGNRDIFLQRVGGGARPLTDNNPRADFQATFDPTGRRIAFRSGRDDRGIFVMGATGETPRPVVEGGFHPAWSSDGERLVYSTVNVPNPYSRGAPLGELWVVDVDSRENTLLYAERDIDAFHPSWSPNDTRIAFAGLIGGQRDIWTIPATGGDPVSVTEDVHTDWGPFWSPDGQYLYFLSDRGARGKPDLWRIPIDQDTGEPQGSPEEVWAPAVGRVTEASISGDKIVCTLALVSSRIVKREFDPETGSVTGREEEIHTSGNQYLMNLSLSPDGNWLNFSTFQGVEDLFVIRPDGSDLLNLTEDLHKDRWPTWYPDIDPNGGVWLTFASDRDGPQYQIYAIRQNGTELRQITDGYQSNAPAWIDGSRLSVTYTPLNGVDSTRIFEFPDGLLGESFGPGQGGLEFDGDASFSPNRQLIGQQEGRFANRRLRVISADGSRRIDQVARDAGGNRFRVPGQSGNRWLDDRRLIFWDLISQKAYLWDIESETATEVAGLTEGEFVFSKDGKTIFILNTTVSSDIWMLELSR